MTQAHILLLLLRMSRSLVSVETHLQSLKSMHPALHFAGRSIKRSGAYQRPHDCVILQELIQSSRAMRLGSLIFMS